MRLIRRQVRQLDDRPDLDRATPGHGNPGGDRDRLVDVARVDQEIAAQLLLGLREGTVRHHALAPTDPDAGCRRGGLEWGGGQILAGPSELVRQLRRLAVTLLPLVGAQGLFVQVDQKHVSHVLTPCPPLPSGEGGLTTTLRQSPRSRGRAPPPQRPRWAAERPAARASGPARRRRTAGRAAAAR